MISKNTIMTITVQFLILVIGFLTSILNARYLGPAGRGDYFFITTLAMVLTQFAQLGLASSNTYLVAKDYNLLGKLLSNSIWISVGIGVFVSVVTLALLALLSNYVPEGTWLLLLLVPSSIFYMLGVNLFVGINEIKAYNLFQVGSSLFLFVLIAVAGIAGYDVYGFLLFNIIGRVVVAIGLLWCLLRYVQTKKTEFGFDKQTYMSGASFGIKTYIITLLGMLILKGNVFLVKSFSSLASLGYYSVASQLNDCLAVLSASIGLVLFPNLVRKSNHQWQDIRKNVWMISGIMLLACLAAAVLVKPLVSIGFGPRFLPAVEIFWWMLPGAFFLGLITIVSQYLAAMGCPRQLLVVWFAGFVVVLGSSFILVPMYAASGAAMSLSITYFVLFGMIFMLAKKVTKEFKLPSGTNYALSAYPLSQAFQEGLHAKVGEPIQYLLPGELRQKKLLDIWLYMRKLKANKFFIVLEDQSSQILLPILQVIAKISGPEEMIVVHSDYEFKTVTFKHLLQSVFKLIKATGLVHLSYRSASRKMLKLVNYSNDTNTSEIKNSKRALYLNANLWFGVKAGGSVGHIAGVINAMVKKGIKVDYAAVDKSSLLDASVDYHQLPFLGSFGIPSELNYYYFNNKVINVISSKKQSNWDFIYQRMSLANFSGVMLSRKLNIPLVIEYNGSEAWIAKNWGRSLLYHESAVRAEEVCLKHANLIVTISEVLKQELIDKGVSAEKIVCYPNCVDPEIFDPQKFSQEDRQKLRSKHNIPDDAIVFTFVGTFGQWHGVDVLAQTIRLFAEKHEAWILENKVHFLLVGDGLKMNEVKNTLGEYINRSYITLTGLVPQNQAPGYLAASDVLLSPHVSNQDGSKFFGSPTKLFEYMAMEKPVIASDLEQIGEVLKNSLRADLLPTEIPDNSQSQLGILCTPGNIEQLLDAIKFLVTQGEWRNVLGRNARKEALAKYTWIQHVEAFLAQ